MNTEETLKQGNEAVLQAIAELSKKIDDHKTETDAKFEQIQKSLDSAEVTFKVVRDSLADNNIRFDRLEGNFHYLRADINTLIEEVRHNRKVLV
jgi:predicted  nucleic acid-binding Zn-ribbon protein